MGQSWVLDVILRIITSIDVDKEKGIYMCPAVWPFLTVTIVLIFLTLYFILVTPTDEKTEAINITWMLRYSKCMEEYLITTPVCILMSLWCTCCKQVVIFVWNQPKNHL